MWLLAIGDEKLRSIGIWAIISHRYNTSNVVLQKTVQSINLSMFLNKYSKYRTKTRHALFNLPIFKEPRKHLISFNLGKPKYSVAVLSVSLTTYIVYISNHIPQLISFSLWRHIATNTLSSTNV